MPAGPDRENQVVPVSAGWPSSAKVGTSGYSGRRCGDDKASNRSLPLSTCALAELSVMNAAGIWLPSKSATAGPAPL